MLEGAHRVGQISVSGTHLPLHLSIPGSSSRLAVNDIAERVLSLDSALSQTLQAAQILHDQYNLLYTDRRRQVAQLHDILAHAAITHPRAAANLAPPHALDASLARSTSLPSNLPTFSFTSRGYSNGEAGPSSRTS